MQNMAEKLDASILQETMTIWMRLQLLLCPSEACMYTSRQHDVSDRILSDKLHGHEMQQECINKTLLPCSLDGCQEGTSRQ